MKKNILFVIVFIVISFFYTCMLLLNTEIINASDRKEDGMLNRYINFDQMYKALNKYEKIKDNGDWKIISPGSVLKKGDSGEKVIQLRHRLTISSDLRSGIIKNNEEFDEVLEEAVKRFQARHGLVVDGIVGPNTLKELNVNIEKRIAQLKLNFKKMKSFSEKLSGKYIIVNIPDFKLDFIENNKSILTMKVIVGKKTRQTPELADEITYLEFNPSWKITYNMTVRDILPLIKNDPDYIYKHNIRLFKGWGDSSVELDARNINWPEVTASNLYFRLEQEPGSENPMGIVKFKFPNSYNVYLHDTPDKKYFKENIRTFSSGCVRLEKPIELAKKILKDYPEWSAADIEDMLNSGKTKVVSLDDYIPIYFVYWTAWVTAESVVNFRKDVYSKENISF